MITTTAKAAIRNVPMVAISVHQTKRLIDDARSLIDDPMGYLVKIAGFWLE
jgi:hypothetical protein